MMFTQSLEEDLQMVREMVDRRAEMERAATREVLRDQFAMAALTGLVSRDQTSSETVEGCVARGHDLVMSAYWFADAMLAARGGK